MDSDAVMMTFNLPQVDLNNTVNEWETSNADDRAFLDSLDEDQVPLKSCHKDALVYRKSKFTAIRQELAEKLFQVSTNLKPIESLSSLRKAITLWKPFRIESNSLLRCKS